MHNPIREIASDTSQSAAGGIERARATPDGPGRCVNQTTAVGRELFSDFFERYPDLRMVHSMLGGGFFSIAQMLLPKASKRADKVQRFESNGDELAQRLRETYAQIRERFQQDVTVAFTNMGMMPDSPQYPRRDVADITGVEWDSYMGTALKGAFNSTAIALREMRATGAAGVVINMARFGLQAGPGLALYSASRAAILSLVETANAEVARDSAPVASYLVDCEGDPSDVEDKVVGLVCDLCTGAYRGRPGLVRV